MTEAVEQKYIENINRQYQPKDEQATKFEQLRRLDAKVRRPAKIFAYAFGGAGTLVLGTGMCLAMKVIADAFVAGIVVGVVGIAMVSLNYFIYKAILRRRKAKRAEEVLKLSNELLNK